jgi:hypothetical protein
MHIYLFVLSRRTNQNTDVSLHLYHILTRFWSLLCSCCTRVYLLCSSGFPSLQPFTTTLQRQEDIHTMTDFSLTLLPGELLLHILEYCSDDVNTLCALDATCLTVRSLTNSFWESLASHKFGSVTGAKRAYLAGRALTTRRPTRFHLENPPGQHRYTSCLAASASLIVMGVVPHVASSGERVAHFPIRVLQASTFKEASCWYHILHEPCHRVAIVANDLVVLQTSPHEVWACHGCAKVKVLLPLQEGRIRAISGSQHGLAIVQESLLCLYTPSTHAALTLVQTIDLEETHPSRTCALNWSLDNTMLAHVGGVDVRVFQWNTLSETPLELVVTFRHGIRVHLLGGTVAVSDKYLVLTQEDKLLWIYTLPTGQFLRNISTSKRWPSGFYNAQLHVCIVTHFLMVMATCGVGPSLLDLRDGSLVRNFCIEEDSELHAMVRLPSMKSLSFMVSFRGGDQMVWGFEGCQELL